MLQIEYEMFLCKSKAEHSLSVNGHVIQSSVTREVGLHVRFQPAR